MRCHLSLIAALVTAGCAASAAPAAPASPAAPSAQPEIVDPAPVVLRLEWQSETHRDHPMVGSIIDVSTGEVVDESRLLSAMAAADYVLLGETHDNADHHQLQARYLARVGEGRELVAWEMIERELPPETREALDRATRPQEVESALAWADSGWPAFELYAPVFAAALELGLPLRGGGLTRKDLAPLFSGGEVDPQLSARFGLDDPVAEETRSVWLDELFEVHCGAMPKEALGPILNAQRLRDAALTEALLDGAKGVLVAGSGHIRKDRAVPAMLEAQGRSSVSVAFVEVDAESLAAADYLGRPYDFVVLTPGRERPDPCERMKTMSKSSG